MRFDAPLREGTLLRRYKRFLADIELDTGETVVAHCPNPGSMATCAPEGARAWVSYSDRKGRKLPYTWEIVDVDGELVSVNPVRSNRLVVEAIEKGRVPELGGYDDLRTEVSWGDSRFDLELSRGEERCIVEVKTATLDVGKHTCAFPDSVTARGARHLEGLARAARRGHRAVLLFCCARSKTRRVQPADHIDPVYGVALRKAMKAGVEVLAYRCRVTPSEVRLDKRIPVVVPAGRQNRDQMRN